MAAVRRRVARQSLDSGGSGDVPTSPGREAYKGTMTTYPCILDHAFYISPPTRGVVGVPLQGAGRLPARLTTATWPANMTTAHRHQSARAANTRMRAMATRSHETNGPARAAIYCRVSSSQQVDNSSLA